MLTQSVKIAERIDDNRHGAEKRDSEVRPDELGSVSRNDSDVVSFAHLREDSGQILGILLTMYSQMLHSLESGSLAS